MLYRSIYKHMDTINNRCINRVCFTVYTKTIAGEGIGNKEREAEKKKKIIKDALQLRIRFNQSVT